MSSVNIAADVLHGGQSVIEEVLLSKLSRIFRPRDRLSFWRCRLASVMSLVSLEASECFRSFLISMISIRTSFRTSDVQDCFDCKSHNNP